MLLVLLRQPHQLPKPPRLARLLLLVLRLRRLPLRPRLAQLPPPRQAQLLREYFRLTRCYQFEDMGANV